MATDSPFELSRAVPADMPELCALLHRAFPSQTCEIFTGYKSDADLPRITEHMAQEWAKDPSMIWLKVVDKLTGRIVAGSEWKVNTSLAPVNQDQWPPEWLEGPIKEASIKLHKGMNESRRKAMPGPFVYLHICFTDPNYQRRGAGAMMLKWGVDLADLLFLPAFIEASKEGNFLYKTVGFYDYEEVNYTGNPMMNMKRDAKVAPLIGGK